MEQESTSQSRAKATAFFERAEQAFGKANFDYAIDMYLEGLRCAPDALEEGHIPLRTLALQRKEKDGKKPSMVEKVKLLQGFIPICYSCKKIRNDDGFWQQVEEYIHEHSDAQFSHGICPDCALKLYPQFYKENK